MKQFEISFTFMGQKNRGSDTQVSGPRFLFLRLQAAHIFSAGRTSRPVSSTPDIHAATAPALAGLMQCLAIKTPPARSVCPIGRRKRKKQGWQHPCLFWRSIRDLNSGGAVNALSHFEFCVPNAVCAPPGSKRAVSSRPFWPHHADFRGIRPQNRVGTSKKYSTTV